MERDWFCTECGHAVSDSSSLRCDLHDSDPVEKRVNILNLHTMNELRVGTRVLTEDGLVWRVTGHSDWSFLASMKPEDIQVTLKRDEHECTITEAYNVWKLRLVAYRISMNDPLLRSVK